MTFARRPRRQRSASTTARAWVFRAPAGHERQARADLAQRRHAAAASTTPPRAPSRTAAGRSSPAPATGRGAVVLLAPRPARATPRPRPTPSGAAEGQRLPRHVPVTYDIGEPVVSWGMQCVGPDPGLALLHRRRRRRPHAACTCRPAVVTVDDPVPPCCRPRPARGRCAAHERDLHRRAHATRPACARCACWSTASPASTRRYPCDYRLAAPCAGARSRDFDLVGVPDGRHTVTTIAEDAASNVTRTEQVIDVDGTAPVIDRVPVERAHASPCSCRDAGSGSRAGRSPCATTPTPPTPR